MTAGGYREIQLTKGFATLVDAEDFEWLSQWKWCALLAGKHTHQPRAARCSRGIMILMHREIAKPPAALLVDHINGNSLDNRRANLRACTHAENARNRRPQRSKALFKGVMQDDRRPLSRFLAMITIDGQRIRLGMFETALDAARAYDAAAIRLHGEFARLNFPEAT